MRRLTYSYLPSQWLVLIYTAWLGEQRHIVCEQLAQSRYEKWSGRNSNLRPLGCKFDTLTTTPPRHTHFVISGTLNSTHYPVFMGFSCLLYIFIWFTLLSITTVIAFVCSVFGDFFSCLFLCFYAFFLICHAPNLHLASSEQ